MTDHVLTSARGAVGGIRLNRPEKRNAIDHQMADRFIAALEDFRTDGRSIIVLSGEPPVFCAGNDLVEARAGAEPAASTRVLQAMMTAPFFFIAAIGGPALGAGVALAAVCPVVVISEDAWFALPEFRLGIFPTGVTMYAESLIGSRRAMTLGLTGDRLGGRAAVEAGLATEVVPIGDECRVAYQWGDRLNGQPQVTDAARRAWQSRFSTHSYVERTAVLADILRNQQIGDPPHAADP